MTYKLKKIERWLEENYVIVLIGVIFASSLLEPQILWRWLGMLTISGVFTFMSLRFMFHVLIKKKDYLEVLKLSGAVSGNRLSESQKKFQKFTFRLMIVVIPIILYFCHFTYVDTFEAIIDKSYIVTEVVTIDDKQTSMGQWYIMQHIETENGKSLRILFSSKPITEGKTYSVTYFPYSGSILEATEVSIERK